MWADLTEAVRDRSNPEFGPHDAYTAPMAVVHWLARHLTLVTYSRTSRTAPVFGGWRRLALVW
jgi:hypothetical protein